MQLSYINQYFDKVYVLNLEKRIDRKMEMFQKLGRLNIKAEFVRAVNGYDFQNQLEYETYLRQPLGTGGTLRELILNRKLIENSGAWGCLKSYLFILEDAQKNGYNRILCLEDDAIFYKNFESRFKDAIQKIPNNWKLLYLGASQRLWEIPRGLSYLDKSKLSIDPNEPFYYPKITFGTFAFGIHHSVFDMMLQEIRKMIYPIDNRPVQIVAEKYPEQCFVITPNLIIADVTDSDIRGKRSQSELAEKLKWNLADYDFPFPKEEHFKLNKVTENLFTMNPSNYRQHRNILIEKHKAIFFIIPKTGCTSLKTQLLKPLGMREKEEGANNFFHPKDFPFPFAEYEELNTTYASYLKFAIVRNPWDRLVSCFKDKIRAADYNELGFKDGVAIPLQRFGETFYGDMTFKAFVDAVCALPDAVADNHFRSQFYQLISPEGELLVNYIGRFERIEQSFAEIAANTGLPLTASIHLNQSQSQKHWRSYYTDELDSMVRKRYAEDIRLLQYSFEAPPVKPIGVIDNKWKEHFSKANLLLPFLEEKNRALNSEMKKLRIDNRIMRSKFHNIKQKQLMEKVQQLERKQKQLMEKVKQLEASQNRPTFGQKLLSVFNRK